MRIEGEQLLEGRDGGGIVIEVVLEGAEVPPTFLPVGMKLDGRLIVAEGLGKIARFARGGGGFGQRVKVSLGRNGGEGIEE